jgi:integrase
MSNLISVFEGKNKRYVVKCNAGIDSETGKQKQINKTFRTLEEAEGFVKLIECELRRGIIKENIHLKRDKNDREPLIWSQEERVRFLKTAEQEKSGSMYDFALSSGIRLLEVLALTWADIDFDQKKVTISKQLSSFSGPSLGKVEVLRNGSHELRLPTNLMGKLQKYQKQQEANKKKLGDEYQHELDLVFPNQNGGFQNPNTVKYRLTKLIEKANVPQIKFHDFRRMYAILLAQSGMGLSMIKTLLRHRDNESTFHLIGRYLPLNDARLFGSPEEEKNKVINTEE